MKRLLLVFVILAIPFICFALTDREAMELGAKNLPSGTEVYDWSKISPLDFLNILKQHPKENVTIHSMPPKNWIKKEHVKQLMELINSQEPASPVVSTLSSYLPSPPSTVGNEAMFLIEGYRKGEYPSTICSVTYFKANPKEFQEWWEKLEVKK